MALISVANLQSFTDKLCAAWIQALAALGSKNGGLVAPTVRNTLNNLQTLTLGLNDYEQESDFIGAANTGFVKSAFESCGQWMQPLTQSLIDHCANRGKEVSTTIVDLASFLSYYNGGSGGALFSSRVCPEMQAIYSAFFNGATLPIAGVMSPAIQPDINPAQTNGMGIKTPGGAFTAANSVNTALYSAVQPVIEVTVTMTGGTGAIAVTINGTDDQGNVATWGPVTLTGNNPVAALSGLTITPAITAQTRVSVACTSTTGIVAGSVLTIQKNKPDQEVVVVESIQDGTHFTAVFKLAHSGGATIDGWNSYAAGNASTGAGRRCQAVTGITFSTINGQSAGTVRIAGQQDRVGA